MCIGIPMQVQRVEPGHALCAGRGEMRRVRTALVGEVAIGEWLLVFIDSAQERIGADRAREIDAALDLLQAVMNGNVDTDATGSVPLVEAAFDLPSRMSTDQLRALSGNTESTPSMITIDTPAADAADLIKLPVQAPKPVETSPLVERLASQHGAIWLDAQSIQPWAALGGDRVVLFAGDPVRFPEGQDVAVVLPELQRSFQGRFAIGIVPRELEEAVARRYGVQRWPSLLFLRDGGYVTLLAGMHDWDDYVREVGRALALPITRAPTIGIPVVSASSASSSDSSCH